MQYNLQYKYDTHNKIQIKYKGEIFSPFPRASAQISKHVKDFADFWLMISVWQGRCNDDARNNDDELNQQQEENKEKIADNV